ncbi:DUF2913 family protein [Photobacterium leiognathi]|uniref:DUF2913 family protein n=1 Tax=Photobacterium leiognathi TaxID=553611 RepID=UPI002739C95B|nr:DUF2913 family protein [Photobacterium leiognathi]
MSKLHYHQQLSTLIDNTLLHLYCHVAISRCFVTTTKRNMILCRYLKPKIKQPQHKSIKGDIKRMVITGQKAGANLELKLEELRKMANDYKESINDAQHLYDLLNHLFDEHGFNSRFFHEGEKTEPEIIYILKDHLEHCFEESGEQIAPVSLLIKFEQNTPDILINVINQTYLFCASLYEHNTETKQTHIHLNSYRKS